MSKPKFRAWDKEGKEMFRVIGITFPVGRNEIIVSGRGGCVILDKDKEGHLLMQFTGLKDKNGKEIYEGDVVTTSNYDTPAKVIFGMGSFQIDYLSANGDMDKPNWIKVIGNIYENPELLK